ncbi:MAG: hypothetical protein KF688_12020 [Pirellulales bacterium]|nr:hypothetical protein [Pirellulales bacterium]
MTDELLKEQTDLLHGADLSGDERRCAESHCREQLKSTVLVEAMVRGRDKQFDVGGFTQSQDGVSRENWQAAWAEAYLSQDGERLLAERWGDPPKVDDFRVAFFLHSWNAAKPLVTSYGEAGCPAVQRMPERLQKLVPYEPVD